MDQGDTGWIGAIHTAEWSEDRMYAITFDLLQSALNTYYLGGDRVNAYGDIRRVLERRGFWNQQGSVYFSNHRDPVQIWKAVTELKEKYDWFSKCVRDLRMLRIDENSDLMPLIGQQSLPLGKPQVRPIAGKPSDPKLN